MGSIAYFDEQPKYFTRITEFEYFRPLPGDTSKQTPTGNFISLPLPDNMPNDSFGASLRDKDLYEAGSAVDVIKEGFSSASAFEQIATSAVGAGIAAVVLGAISKKTPLIGDMVGAGIGLNQALEFGGAYLGMTRNPHTALIFDKMNMRTFSLGFRLSPRNEKQSQKLDQILNVFKLGMHPSYNKVGKGFVLDYPNLYKIEFANMDYNGVPKIDFCFLKDMSVSVTPQGHVLYRDGYPSFVDVRLDFAEIDMKTRDWFTGGGVGMNSDAGNLRNPFDVGPGKPGE